MTYFSCHFHSPCFCNPCSRGSKIPRDKLALQRGSHGTKILAPTDHQAPVCGQQPARHSGLPAVMWGFLGVGLSRWPAASKALWPASGDVRVPGGGSFEVASRHLAPWDASSSRRPWVVVFWGIPSQKQSDKPPSRFLTHKYMRIISGGCVKSFYLGVISYTAICDYLPRDGIMELWDMYILTKDLFPASMMQRFLFPHTFSNVC